jgi:pantoate--beta-alanine ligase
MRVCDTIAETRAILHDRRARGEAIGLVPTMGAFHEGHLSLMRRSRELDGCVVVSLFVNPTQFGPGEDFPAYPRDLEGDLRLAEQIGVDLVFAPEVGEMYPDGFQTHVEVERLTQGLCGAFRPGHFRGVATVCCKLFNMIAPHRAYFGEKDYQQLKVIQRLVADLNMEVQIVPLPTVREPDGLAMSSRNAYLTPDERRAALALVRSLTAAQKVVQSGDRQAEAVLAAMRAVFDAEPRARLQYAEVVDAETLEPLATIDRPARALVAAYVGQTRLIDNCPLG